MKFERTTERVVTAVETVEMQETTVEILENAFRWYRIYQDSKDGEDFSSCWGLCCALGIIIGVKESTIINLFRSLYREHTNKYIKTSVLVFALTEIA